MDERKFTPGPWFFGREASEQFDEWSVDAPGGYQAWCIAAGDRDEAPVALVTSKLWDDATHDANAKLIAAAPVMYDRHDRNLGDLVLLRMAVESGDPAKELLFRIDDMIENTQHALSQALGSASADEAQT